MNKKTLSNIVKAVGLGTALAVSSGCVPVGRGDYAGFGTNALQGAQFLNAVEANNIQRDRNQAYANNQGGQNNGQPSPVFFACNYRKDINGDGFFSYPDDYFGIRTEQVPRFYHDENILMVANNIKNKKGQEYTQVLFNAKGEELDRGSYKIPSDNIHASISCGPGWLEPGRYSAVWSGAFSGKVEFEVLERK